MAESIKTNIHTVEAVQNSALCAALLWAFGRGYQKNRPDHLPILQLSFLVLPMILHSQTLECIISTNSASGLGKLVEKISKKQRNDLLAIHPRVMLMRPLTLEAVSTGIATGLISVLYDDGLVRANDLYIPRLPTRVKKMVDAAQKLGGWVAHVPDANVFAILKVHP